MRTDLKMKWGEDSLIVKDWLTSFGVTDSNDTIQRKFEKLVNPSAELNSSAAFI